jgi:hypothetical protein
MQNIMRHYMVWVIMLPIALCVVHDLVEVVVFLCFKFVFCSVDWRCGIKVLFLYSVNQKIITAAFDRLTGRGLTSDGLTGSL